MINLINQAHKREQTRKHKGVFGVCLFIILCWCMVLRQAVQALPWEDSIWLPCRDALLVIGLSVGAFGALVCFGGLMMRCIGELVPSIWYKDLSSTLGCLSKGHIFSVLILIATLCCATPFIIPEVARYWGVGCESGVQAYGVLNVNDLQWWNPAWLYIRLLFTLILAWGGVLVLQRSKIGKGTAAVMLVLLVLTVGNLGFELIAAPTECVQSIYPIYMVISALLAGLSSAMLVQSSVGRCGALLTALVMLKLWLVFSLCMILWYARMPHELAILNHLCNEWFSIAFIIQLGVPFIALLFRQIRKSHRGRKVLSACVVFGVLAECYVWFTSLPQFGGGAPAWWSGVIVVVLCALVMWCCVRKEGRYV